jgi:hypothetical protein
MGDLVRGGGQRLQQREPGGRLERRGEALSQRTSLLTARSSGDHEPTAEMIDIRLKVNDAIMALLWRHNKSTCATKWRHPASWCSHVGFIAGCRAGAGRPAGVLAGKEYGSGSSRDWAANVPVVGGIMQYVLRSLLAKS